VGDRHVIRIEGNVLDREGARTVSGRGPLKLADGVLNLNRCTRNHCAGRVNHGTAY